MADRAFEAFRPLVNAVRVRVATTANITIATALNSGDTLDGVTLADGMLVLVKDQSAPAENGIYVVGTVPRRYVDFSADIRGTTGAYDMHPGLIVVVEQGTANADTIWLCTSNRGGTLGTTALTFVQQYPPATDTVAGILEIATQAEQETGTATDKIVTPGRQHYHASAAKFWAYVTVSGGTPTLAASYNVTSITDTGVGQLTVTIATDFSSANWSGQVTTQNTGGVLNVSSMETIAAGSCLAVSLTVAPAFTDPGAWHIEGKGDQ